MEIITSVSKMTQWAKDVHGGNQTIAFVPTLGNLHEGHLSLVRGAKKNADKVVVSIFVNPLQFGPTEDFKTYPRTFEADVEKLNGELIDVLFCPETQDLYPQGFQTSVFVKYL